MAIHDTTLPSFTKICSNITTDLRSWIDTQAYTPPVMVGIHTGGTWLARALHQSLSIAHPLGELGISFYRDDFSRVGINPQVNASQLPVSLDDQTIILVDDVVQSGRTIRAAMNELFDYGRPAQICLVAGVFRLNGRELPIVPDVFGTKVSLPSNSHVKLRGPDSPYFEIVEKVK